MTKLKFSIQCFLALIIGALLGLVAPSGLMSVLSVIGQGFLQLLGMIIIPLTFPLIVASFAKLKDLTQLQSLGLRTLFWFVATALIAGAVGLSMGLLFHPGGLPAAEASDHLREVPTFTKIFLDMLPGNLIGQVASGKIIPMILFAVLFGIALALVGEPAKPVREFFVGFSEVMFKITRWIIRLAPIGIIALISEVTAHYGLTGLLPFATFILTVYCACAVQLIVYAVLIATRLGRNPFTFFKAIWPALITAFTTSSSLGTLPVTLQNLVERVGVPSEVASFVAPLGSTMKMDGCGAIYPAIVAVFTAGLFHIHLGMTDYLTILITCALATIGTAGVPGTASVMTMVVLSSVGLPFTGLAMVVGIDKIIDMMRTMVNVAGTATCTTLIAGRRSSP